MEVRRKLDGSELIQRLRTNDVSLWMAFGQAAELK
jgi:hypothetical protein